MYGVGFVVRGNLRDSVIGWVPVNERICVIRLRGTFYNTSIICAYAPTDVSSNLSAHQLGTLKDTFYDQLDAAFDACPKHDAKYLVGDFNAKIGRERIFEGIIGMHSLHSKSSDNGCRLINFAASKEMVVSSTYFPHKDIHKGTWILRNGKGANQIDHVLVDARHASNVLDVRAYRGANVDSDHLLVIAKIRSRISMAKSEKQQGRKGFNIDALGTSEKSVLFARTVSRNLENAPANSSVEEMWKHCSTALTDAANETLGPPRRKPRKGWFDDDCAKAVKEKNVEEEDRPDMPSQKARFRR